MKNSDQWRPSKFVYNRDRLIASRDAMEVGVSSRLGADLIAAQYDTYLKKFAKGKLIDLGCGKVPLYGSYKEFVSDCVCVDWANGIQNNPYLDRECDLNEPLPFASEEFDTILLSDVLEHIANPVALWGEMARIIKPGGNLILNVPFLYKIHSMPHDYYRYTEYALARFAVANGFTIILFNRIGGSPEVVADLIAKTIVHAPVMGKPAAAFIQFLCKVFTWTSFGKNISIKTGKTAPLAYFLVATKN